MPVPMMLAITIEHAVTKPMVRFGGADLTATRWVSVVIRGKFYSSFLLQNAEHPRFNAKIGFMLGQTHFRRLSEALAGLSLQHHERTFHALH